MKQNFIVAMSTLFSWIIKSYTIQSPKELVLIFKKN